LYKKARKGYFVGYLDEGQEYHVYVPSVRDVILSRDVMFKSEQVSMEVINLSLPKNIESEDMYAQSYEVRTSESAESEHESIEQRHVAGENVRQLRGSQTN
jgi:hypothetical protein